MRKFEEFRTTTNRTIYNRISLFYEDVWSSRERDRQRTRWYGERNYRRRNIRYPNWKMLKKQKQWMEPAFTKRYYRYRTWDKDGVKLVESFKFVI
jgi:hypothetical protein